jgi:hypothetical protein
MMALGWHVFLKFDSRTVARTKYFCVAMMGVKVFLSDYLFPTVPDLDFLGRQARGWNSRRFDLQTYFHVRTNQMIRWRVNGINNVPQTE